MVNNLFSGSCQNSADQAVVSQGTPPAGDPVLVNINGMTCSDANLQWNGTNTNGQAVQGGTYYIKICSTTEFGAITCISDPITVLNETNPSSLLVYNSAGEVVADLNVAGLPSPAMGISVNLAGGATGIVVSPNPNALSPTGGVQIQVTMADGVTTTAYWNGYSEAGQPVQSGSYLIQLSTSVPGSSAQLKSIPITVLGSEDQSVQGMALSAYAAPNPVLDGSTGFTVQYKGNGVDSAVGVLYDLAGERVAQAEAGPVSGPAVLHFAGKLSAGVYMLDFEVRDGEVALARHVLKVAIVK
jgi:flagellar hook assembly protein FlgD